MTGGLQSVNWGSLASLARPSQSKVEFSLLAVATPFLLFPHGNFPWIGLGLLVAGRVLFSLRKRVWLVRTPLSRPLAIIALMTLVSLYPSVDLTLSMPKFYGIVLGLFVCCATIGNVIKERHFWLGIGLLLAAIVAISIVGLIGTEWSIGKYHVLQEVYSRIPRLIRGVESSVGPVAGFNPNELGGALAFLLPLPVALILHGRLSRWQWLIIGPATLLGLGVLGLSASRSALTSTAVAFFCLLVWRWRRAGILLAVVVVTTLAIAAKLHAEVLADYLFRIDTAHTAFEAESLAGRIEIWERALFMLEDFPFTGIGLNTFPIVLDTLYPSFQIGPDARIPHAHNILLQTAVDLGLGGLLGFIGLWACVAYAGRRAYRLVGPSVRTAVIGLLLGLLSYLTYGMTDAITFGAKPTVLLWLMMGLIVAAERVGHQHSACSDPRLSLEPRPATAPFLRRTIALILATACDAYWIIAFFLVAMGYLVVGLGVSGWVL